MGSDPRRTRRFADAGGLQRPHLQCQASEPRAFLANGHCSKSRAGPVISRRAVLALLRSLHCFRPIAHGPPDATSVESLDACFSRSLQNHVQRRSNAPNDDIARLVPGLACNLRAPRQVTQALPCAMMLAYKDSRISLSL